MIALEEVLHRVDGLERRELIRWVENRWVLPERRNDTWIFDEVDIARVELIVEEAFRLVEKSADQGRFAVIDGAADDGPQQILLFLPRHEILERERGELGRCYHLEIPLLLLALH